MSLAISDVQNALSPETLALQFRLNLCAEPLHSNQYHFTFRYTGQTCSWGGQPIEALMHAVVEQRAGCLFIQRGWIDLPPNSAGTHFMCEYQRRGRAALDQLVLGAEHAGHELGEIIKLMDSGDTKPCFCRKEMIDHKWGLMAAVIRQWQVQALNADAA